MRPVLLGTCLGILNVVANAALFAVLGDEPRFAGHILTLGILPGIIAGSLLGALAGATANTPWASRLLVLGMPAVLVVVMLAEAFKVTSFIPISLVPTLLCCVLLEWRTRKDPVSIDAIAAITAQATDTPPRTMPRSALKLSMILGAAVMFVVLLGVMAKEDVLDCLAQAYLPWGLGCGLGLASPFGVVADQTRNWSVWQRRFTLLVLGFALTAALGSVVQMESLILVAFLPVAAGCLILEAYSRVPPAVPLAIARAQR
jgi:hypothetical protein